MKYWYHNTTGTYQYPGGRALAPGESIELDSDQCPEFAPAGLDAPPVEMIDADAARAAAVAAARKQTAAELIAQVPEMESGLLVALGEAEQADAHPRKTLLSAIAEEQLARAEAEAKAAQEAAANA